MTLIPCTDLSPAAWLVNSTREWDVLAGFGPDAFDAHARLRFRSDPAYPGQQENDADTEDTPTETDMLRTTLGTLAGYTRTPDECYFALWDGWGSDLEAGATSRDQDVVPAFPPAVMNGPKVEIPNRAYYLFRGKLSDFGDWGETEMWPGQPRFSMPDPAFIWPADHAWCIANDVDPHWAGIGARTEAISALLAIADLDVVRANPHEVQPAYF